MKYEIFYDNIRSELERRVNEAISAGYEPLGGIALGLASDNTWFFYQAMIKREVG